MRGLLAWGLALAVTMSACAPAATLTVPPTFTVVPTITPAPPATATLDPTPTPTLTITPTDTPAPPIFTPEPPTPTAPPTLTPEPYDPQAGVNSVAFVQDITIPDRTPIGIGATFTKTWRLQNTGTLPWTTGYALVRVAGDALGAPLTLPLTERVEPGAQVDVSVVFTAPVRSGRYRSEWQLRAPDGALFGTGETRDKTFYVEVRVVEAINGTPVPTPVGSRVPLVVDTVTLNAPNLPGPVACPHTLTFTGAVRASGVGRYSYRLETNATDPAVVAALPGTVESYRQGTEPSTMPLTLTLTVATTFSADFRLHGLTPRQLFSAPVALAVQCVP